MFVLGLALLSTLRSASITSSFAQDAWPDGPTWSPRDRRSLRAKHINALIRRKDWAAIAKLGAPNAVFIVSLQSYPDNSIEYSGLRYKVSVWPLALTAHPPRDLAKELNDISFCVKGAAYANDQGYYKTFNAFREIPFPSIGWIGQTDSAGYWEIVLDSHLRIESITFGAH